VCTRELDVQVKAHTLIFEIKIISVKIGSHICLQFREENIFIFLTKVMQEAQPDISLNKKEKQKEKGNYVKTFSENT